MWGICPRYSSLRLEGSRKEGDDPNASREFLVEPVDIEVVKAVNLLVRTNLNGVPDIMAYIL